MSKTPVSLITPELSKMYLTNVAQALSNIVIPALDGAANARANDCLRIISRLVSDSELSEQTLAQLKQGVSNNSLTALDDGDLISAMNSEGEQQLSAFKNTPPIAGRHFDHTNLEAYLREHPLGGDSLRIKESRLLPGGRSKITALVSLQNAVGLPNEIVVRQDWENSVTGKSVALEYELLLRLHKEGILVPKPLVYETTGDITGNIFLIFPRMQGIAIGDNFMVLPDDEQPLMQLAEQLGRLHSLDVAPFSALEGIAERQYTTQQLNDSLTEYAATIATLDTAESSLITETIEWLQSNAKRVATLPQSLVHGDLGFHNLLVDGDTLTGLLDWELAHIGNPAYDLGYIRHAVTDDVLWAKFISHYKKGGGQDIEPDFIDYYCLYTGIWYHQIQLQVRSALCSGAINDIEMSALAADFAPRVLSSISRTLHRVLIKT